jgi:hypothetical protein
MLSAICYYYREMRYLLHTDRGAFFFLGAATFLTTIFLATTFLATTFLTTTFLTTAFLTAFVAGAFPTARVAKRGALNAWAEAKSKTKTVATFIFNI